MEELRAPDPAGPTGASTPSVARRRRLLIGVGGLSLAVAALGGIVVASVPRVGAALPNDERAQLLQQAGLPPDFPVHPYARRSVQSAQGGISYTLNEPVPDVLAWHHDSLIRSGYQVFNADVSGQDEFLPRWIYFSSEDGVSGAIIIRQSGRSLDQNTEVKILSRADPRLTPPTVPASVRPR